MATDTLEVEVIGQQAPVDIGVFLRQIGAKSGDMTRTCGNRILGSTFQCRGCAVNYGEKGYPTNPDCPFYVDTFITGGGGVGKPRYEVNSIPKEVSVHIDNNDTQESLRALIDFILGTYGWRPGDTRG